MTEAAMDGGGQVPVDNSNSPLSAEKVGETASPPADDPLSIFRSHKHRYKSPGGKEVEVDYDELGRRASLGEGAEKKLQDVARQRKELEEKFGKLSNAEAENWEDIIDVIGWDKAKKFAETLLWNNIQWEELPEAERRAILAEQKASKLEAKEKERETKAQEEQKAQALQQAYAVIDKEISEAIAEAKAEGITVADMPEVIEGVVDEMLAYLEYIEAEEASGRTPKSSTLSPKDVLRKIQDRTNERSSAYVKKLNVEQLKALLTREQLSALRQLELDHLHAPIPTAGTKSGKKSDVSTFDVEPKKSPRRMNSNDFFSKMDSKYGR